MERGRHSISTDKEEVITSHFQAHMDHWKSGEAWDGSAIPFQLLGEEDLGNHPVFGLHPG